MKPAADHPAPGKDWFVHPALARWRKKLKEGRAYSLAAIPAAAQAFVAAALVHGTGRAALVLAPGVKGQEEFANDLEAWDAQAALPLFFFPEADARVAQALPDQNLAAERLSIARRIQQAHGREVQPLILATRAGFAQPLPLPTQLAKEMVLLAVGATRPREAWLAALEKAGYQREAEVEGHGQFSVRGSLVDVFSWAAALPVRSEWDGNEIVSLREFEPATQRSVGTLDETEISLSLPTPEGALDLGSATLEDYLPANTVTFVLDEGEGEKATLVDLEFFAHDFLHARAGDWIVQERRRGLFIDHLRGWLDEGWQVAVACNNEGEEKRLREILTEERIDLEPIEFTQRRLLRGFVWPEAKRVVLSDAEIFGRYQTLRALRRQERRLPPPPRRETAAFGDWKEGDYVVHLHYGIARYVGLQPLPDAGNGDGVTGGSEALVLSFALGAKLYVPLEDAYLVSRYLGATKRAPALDQLGGPRWEKAKAQAHKAVAEYARKLIAVQAERAAVEGHAFGPDTAWQTEFEEAFVYEETEDQLKAIAETKHDMESRRPMERLICGDVGFGKTEIAIRAAFKAAMDGRQVAFLVPTTVLAQQHFQNLRERYADYPVRVELLSRYRRKEEQAAVLAGMADGSVDVVVGTHRLLSKDVIFKNLGLVVIDEEQRFGVVQKEKFKQLFRLVDVLTLSATPIPRTLYLAMTGARDMSTIETPPSNRQSVETIISPYDERVIRAAIERELARDGQVYFLHNRVQTIERMAARLRELVPKARVEIGHGQMDKHELEDVMRRFVSGETQILLATTIIESGLDIPNANTIIIDRADRFGLADLYQLRGRVGRSQSKAHAYLLLPREMMGVGDARKRIGAMRQYAALGSGFKLAMRDLEIRGAGNLLGTAQSGHITAIGFDLYCHLLKRAVSRLKGGEAAALRPECRVVLDFVALHQGGADDARPPAALPASYLPESRWRIEGYRRLAEAASLADLEALRREWRDRHGAWPPAVERLLAVSELRLLGAERGLTLIETQGPKLIFKRGAGNGDFVMIGGKFPRLTASGAENRLKEIRQWLLSLA
jgi:transcription-repair coupling factor (superfamily II helicase)